MLQLLETVSGLAIGQMVAERATLVMRMSELEDWDIVAASHKTGALLLLRPCVPPERPFVHNKNDHPASTWDGEAQDR
jgi:hypothetical protein